MLMNVRPLTDRGTVAVSVYFWVSAAGTDRSTRDPSADIQRPQAIDERAKGEALNCFADGTS